MLSRLDEKLRIGLLGHFLKNKLIFPKVSFKCNKLTEKPIIGVWRLDGCVDMRVCVCLVGACVWGFAPCGPSCFISLPYISVRLHSLVSLSALEAEAAAAAEGMYEALLSCLGDE